MWHRLSIAAAFLMLLTFGGGCTKVVRISMEEARKHPTEKPRAIEVATAIRGVELKTGEFVAFSEPTGDYRPQTQELAGTKTSGDSLVVALKETRSIHVRPVNHSTQENVVLPTDRFFRTYSAIAAPDSGKGLYPLSTRIQFNRHKGQIDTVRNCLSGTGKNRLPVNVSCDDVFRVEYKRISLGKTLVTSALAVGILSAVTGFFALIIGDNLFTSDNPL